MLPEYQTELNQPRTNELVVNAKNHCRLINWVDPSTKLFSLRINRQKEYSTHVPLVQKMFDQAP